MARGGGNGGGRHGAGLVVAAAAAGAALAPGTVHAHMTVASGSFYGGLLHPWIHPDSALLLWAALLWIVQRHRPDDPWPGAALAGGLAVGSAAGMFAAAASPAAGAGGAAPGVYGTVWTVAAYGAATLCGLSVAANLAPNRRLLTAAAGIAGVAAGSLAATDARPDVDAPLLFAGGAAVGAVVVPALVAGALAGRDHPAAAIGIRILGSWIAAAGVMLTALALAPPAP